MLYQILTVWVEFHHPTEDLQTLEKDLTILSFETRALFLSSSVILLAALPRQQSQRRMILTWRLYGQMLDPARTQLFYVFASDVKYIAVP